MATLGKEVRKKIADKCRRLSREMKGVMRNLCLPITPSFPSLKRRLTVPLISNGN